MDVVDFGRLNAQQRRELEGDEADPFDLGDSTLRYRPKDHHVALQDETGRLVASTGMLVVDVEVGGRLFPVVGFGGVIVNSRMRGRGLAREVVTAALAKARTLGPAFVILFCLEDRVGLYLKLGFAEVRSRVLVAQPGGMSAMPNRTMWSALSPGVTWPSGELVIDSLPF
jgi:predicted N-acetyltransferase YhbS